MVGRITGAVEAIAVHLNRRTGRFRGRARRHIVAAGMRADPIDIVVQPAWNIPSKYWKSSTALRGCLPAGVSAPLITYMRGAGALIAA